MIAEQISSIFWLLHSDLHEIKVTSALEYLSSVVASVEPLHQTAGGKRGDLENLSLLEQNFGKGKLQVRFKRRNGRVRVVVSVSLLFSLCFLSFFCFFGRVWWDLLPLIMKHQIAVTDFYSVFRMKDFILISQATILHLFHLKMG
jgi:hypothetical protein